MAGLLTVLDRKLLRDLWRIRGQAVAIALVVAAGIALYVMSAGMLAALTETRAAYYEQYRFADIFAPVKRAPLRSLEEIAALPGVTAVTGRINGALLAELPGKAMPVSGRAVSLPTAGPSAGMGGLNAVHLVAGRMPEPGGADEALVLAPFATAHGLRPGDRLRVIMNGVRRDLRIVGTALSPDFVYTLAPGELVPDDGRFTVVWMDQAILAAGYDLKGAYNEALVKLSPGTAALPVLDGVDRILASHGGIGAYPRDDHVSDRFLTEELSQLATMGRVLPPIFLLVAAFLLNIVMSRLVDAERTDIGLMKAFGYRDREVGWHFARFVGVLVLGGVVLGSAIGALLGQFLAGIYQEYYHFPFLVFRLPPSAFGIAGAVALVSAGLGVWLAARRAVRLAPAAAMHPPAPPVFVRAGPLGRRVEQAFDQPGRMVLRRLRHQPIRAALTCLGIAASMALLVTMNFNRDAVAAMIDISFHVIDRADMTVTFTEPQPEAAIFGLRRMEGVIAVEPVRELAVRMVHGHRERLGSITGLSPDARLGRAVDAGFRSIPMRRDGIVVSQALAELLAVEPGDRLVLDVREGRRPLLEVPVTGIAATLIGTAAYMELDALNRLVGDGPRSTAAHLLVDPARRDAVATRLAAMPRVAGVTDRRAAKAAFQRVMDEGMGVFRVAMSLFAIVIAVGVVYNAARIAFAERARDLASLRVIGLTKGEAGYILLGELAVLTLLALPLGALMGYGLSLLVATAFSTDLYRIPVVILPAGYGEAALVVLAAAILSGWLVQRSVNALDLVVALKTRE